MNRVPDIFALLILSVGVGACHSDGLVSGFSDGSTPSDASTSNQDAAVTPDAAIAIPDGSLVTDGSLCSAIGRPNTMNVERPLLDLVKKDALDGACIRIGLSRSSGDPANPSGMTSPSPWRVVTIERYPNNWDCSATFHFGIPDDQAIFAQSNGAITFSNEMDAANLPCKVSVHGGVVLGGFTRSFDADMLVVGNACN